MSVLLVDDHAGLLQGLSRSLAGLMPVLTASSARSALELLSHEPVDAIVTDFDLGEGREDGLWLLREVSWRWPEMRRVMMTGGPDDRVRLAVADGLVEQLLLKPSGRAALLSAIGATSPTTAAAE
jgi:two-component system response regulator YesN